MKDDQTLLTNKLNRIDNEIINNEVKIKEQRKYLDELDAEYKECNENELKIEKETNNLISQIKTHEVPHQMRLSHLNKEREESGNSVFTNKEPSIIRQNRTLIGGKSIVGGSRPVPKNANKAVKSSRGFCSVFGSAKSKK